MAGIGHITTAGSSRVLHITRHCLLSFLTFWDGCPCSYTFQNQWVHPNRDLLFSPSNLWEISSTRGEKTWQIWSIAKKSLNFFFYYYDFPPVVLGLHLMITMLYILGESLSTSKFSWLIIWIGIPPGSNFVVYVFDSFFTWNWPHCHVF